MSVQISTLIDELSILPEQSSATMQLLRLLDDPDADAKDIVPVIEADPSMTARLLTLANSAFFGLKTHASNVWSAVMVVGFNVVRALATTGGLGLSDPRPGAMPEGYWSHAVASGAAASTVAKRIGVRASDAFSAGLLHDLGAALLYRAATERYIEAQVDRGGITYFDLHAEVRIMGAGHDAVGAAVLEQLYFPTILVNAVRDHHLHPDDISDTMTRIVSAGISLTETRLTPSCTQPAAEHLAAAMRALDLPEEPDDELLDQLDREVADLRAMLG
ncbi:MAG: HDOD domain-containing protein [Actinomycetota bacterium]